MLHNELATRGVTCPIHADLFHSTDIRTLLLRPERIQNVSTDLPGMLTLCPSPYSNVVLSHCLFGRRRGPRRVVISFSPCICAPARQADERGV